MSPKRRQDAESLPGSVWLRPPRPTPRAPALTRDRIVTATVEVLDRHGSAGLSMRKLAETLDVHATSLYWHVSTRDDLLDLALDAVFGEVALQDTERDSWSADLAAFMTELRVALLRHPWSAPLASSRPPLGPNALARSEVVHAALVTAGFTGTDLYAAAAAVTNYVIGSASAEAAWQHEGQTTARRALVDHIRDAADRYPTLAAHPPSVEGDWEAHFTCGMELLLAGLVAGRNGAPGDVTQ